jgi:hypothetical protein
MPRLLYLGIGIVLVVFAFLAFHFKHSKQAGGNHATDRISERAAKTDRRTSVEPTDTAKNPPLVDPERMKTLLKPSGPRESVGNLPTSSRGMVNHLEIEVSHSAHVFRLCASTSLGKKKLLYECRVGLGNPHEFPTPVGVYFVTRIYDDDPWWIPPANQEWAAGQKPNRKVYGGTMAPLLKKRPLKTTNQKPTPTPDSDDNIAGQIQLNDDGYSFHGTNEPNSIGRNQSHGDIVMLPNDARKVANLIKEWVGVAGRKESENGTYAVLNAPVRLNLVK